MKKLHYNEDKKFTVLQISDVQELLWMRKACLNMMNEALDFVKPDLVVYTGDNVLGNHICDHRFGNKKHNYDHDRQLKIIKKCLDQIFSLPEKRNIPFAVIFGNHDDMNDVTKQEQVEFFKTYKNYVDCDIPSSESTSRDRVDSLVGNYTIPVYSADGEEEKLELIMVDTSRHEHDGEQRDDADYGNVITAEQTQWLRDMTARERSEGKNVPKIMFLHVPLRETNYFVKECDENEADCSDGRDYYKLINSRASGVLNEPIRGLDEENNFYDAILENGNIKAIVSGHDHTNRFEGVRDNIRFIQSPGASFRCYGNIERGVRVFEFEQDNVEHFKTGVLRYHDLCGSSLRSQMQYVWDADGMEKAKAFMIGSIAVLVGGTAAVIGSAAKKILHVCRRR